MTDTTTAPLPLPLPGTPWAAWRAAVATALCLTEWDVESMDDSYSCFNSSMTPAEFEAALWDELKF